jgi:hypothetical protein
MTLVLQFHLNTQVTQQPIQARYLLLGLAPLQHLAPVRYQQPELAHLLQQLELVLLQLRAQAH